MYALVADIPAYNEFLNWCGDSQVLSRQGDVVTASITIAYKGLHKTFITRNHMRPFNCITIELVEGPFSHLEGKWLFIELDDDASKMELDLEFHFHNPLVAKLVGPVFSHIANNQVEAFQRRAQQLYG